MPNASGRKSWPRRADTCTSAVPMKTDAVLYSFRRCPYAMRARMALHVSGIRYGHREVVLRDKPAAMLEASPKGTIPVLVTPEGSVIDESLDIMHWALEQDDPEEWLAKRDTELIDANDGPFKHHLDRYKYATRYTDVDPDDHRTEALRHLADLNARLADQAYLHGSTRGLTDIALFPFVRQFANTDRAWFASQSVPNVQDWLQRLVGSNLFAAVMHKHEPWVPA